MMSITACNGEGERTSTRAAAAITLAALVLAVSGCGSDSAAGTGDTTAVAVSTASVATEPLSPAVAADRALAQAALLVPDDLDGNWRALGPEGDFPSSAELARTVPACANFADLVFDGGADHGAAETVTLQREDSLLYNYVVIFESPEEAAAMVTAVGSPEFDDCWSQFMGVAVQAYPQDISDARYVTATPPEMEFVADSYATKMVTGTIVVDGSESDDSCICVFAQVGRAVAVVHSAAAHFDAEERILLTQTGIDKARDVIG
jgi:hypothetical protein